MENNNNSSKALILNYGLILGGIAILISLIQYALGEHLSPKPVYGIVSFVLMILAIVFGVKNLKKANHGYISFGEAIKVGVGIAVVSAIISIVYNLIFINFVEPDFIDQMLQKQEQDMFNKGMNEKQIEAAMGMANKMKGPFISSAVGIVASAFFGFVISAITGAIVKKSKEEIA